MITKFAFERRGPGVYLCVRDQYTCQKTKTNTSQGAVEKVAMEKIEFCEESVPKPVDTNPRQAMKNWPNIRRFEVHYGRIIIDSSRSVDLYGTLEFDMDIGNLTLRNEEGLFLGSIVYLKGTPLVEGTELVITTKTVTIIKERELKIKPRTVSVTGPTTGLNPHGQSPLPETLPLSPEKIVILCRPSGKQIQKFNEIYDKIPGAPDTKLSRLFSDLDRYCNYMSDDDYPGKLTVLLGIVKGSLELNESVLIIVDKNFDYGQDMQEICSKEFKEQCYLFEEYEDVPLEPLDNKESKICIVSRDLLQEYHYDEEPSILRKQGLKFHRAIAYGNYDDLETVNLLITGPFYVMITSGSVEERNFQMKNRRFPTREVIDRLYDAPGNYHDSDTHMMLNCRCLTGEVDSDEEYYSDIGYGPGAKIEYETRHVLKFEWDHIPGDKVEPAEHLQVGALSDECKASIAFLFKKHRD